MAIHRLPTPNSDDGTWGDILNDFLAQAHNSDGSLLDGIITDVKVSASAAISKTKLAPGVQSSLSNADSAVQTVNGKAPTSGAVSLAAADVGAPSKPVSGADGKPLKWNNTSGQLEDATATLNANYAPVRTFDVLTYGAVGDGTTDDTTAVQAALTAANTAGGGVVYFPADKTYLCTDLTIPGSNIIIQGGGWSAVLKQKFVAGDNHYLLSVNPGSGGTADPSQNTTGIVMRDIQLRGTCDTDGFEQYVHLLNINAASDVLIHNVFFKGFRGDGLYLGSGNSGSVERHNQHIKVTACKFDGINSANRNAISVIDGDDVNISGCTFLNTTASNMPGAIDLEPNPGSTFAVIRNIRIVGNHFTNIGGNTGVIAIALQNPQASFTTPSQNIVISDNTMSGCVNNSQFFFLQPQQPAPSDVANDVLFSNNIMSGSTGEIFEIAGIRGLRMSGNTWNGFGNAAAIGYTDKVADVVVSDNNFHGCGWNTGEVFAVIRASRLYLINNYVDALSGDFIRFQIDGSSTGASDNICASGNIIKNGGTNFSSQNASHTLTLATNLVRDNDLSGLSNTVINTVHFTPESITVSVAWDPPSLITGSATTTTVSVAGAATTDSVVLNHSSVDAAGTAWLMYGYVSAAGTVTVVLMNQTGSTVDLASGTLRVKVIKL